MYVLTDGPGSQVHRPRTASIRWGRTVFGCYFHMSGFDNVPSKQMLHNHFRSDVVDVFAIHALVCRILVGG